MSKIKINKNTWTSFFLTLIATLAGVVIGIWLTNSGIRSKEKEDTIKLLNTAKIVLENTKTYTNTLTNTILNLEKDTINYTKESIQAIKLSNPIPYPVLLETILSNDLFSKNVSEFTHKSVFIRLLNIKKVANYEASEVYQRTLDELILNIQLEIQFLKNEISLKELQTNYISRQLEIEKKYSNESVLEISPQ